MAREPQRYYFDPEPTSLTYWEFKRNGRRTDNRPTQGLQPPIIDAWGIDQPQPVEGVDYDPVTQRISRTPLEAGVEPVFDPDGATPPEQPFPTITRTWTIITRPEAPPSENYNKFNQDILTQPTWTGLVDSASNVNQVKTYIQRLNQINYFSTFSEFDRTHDGVRRIIKVIYRDTPFVQVPTTAEQAEVDPVLAGANLPNCVALWDELSAARAARRG